MLDIHCVPNPEDRPRKLPLPLEAKKSSFDSALVFLSWLSPSDLPKENWWTALNPPHSLTVQPSLAWSARVRGGSQTNRERFADICNSLLSQIDNESYLYQKFWLSMPFEYVCLYYVYGTKASNRKYVQDSVPISLSRLWKISVKRSRLVSVSPLNCCLPNTCFPTITFLSRAENLWNDFWQASSGQQKAPGHFLEAVVSNVVSSSCSSAIALVQEENVRWMSSLRWNVDLYSFTWIWEHVNCQIGLKRGVTGNSVATMFYCLCVLEIPK